MNTQDVVAEFHSSILTIGTYDRSECGIVTDKTRDISDDMEAAEAVMDKTGISELGTGFIYTYNGVQYIITCEHVLYKAGRIVGFDARYNEYELELVGSDMQYDIGVLKFKNKVDSENFNGLEFQCEAPDAEDTTFTHVGFWKADGYPNIKRGKTIHRQKGDFQNNHIIGLGHLESTAYIPGGFSGGPVMNIQGLVLGMNTARDKKGTSYALRAQILRRLVHDIIDDRKVNRAFSGLEFAQVSDENNVFINSIIENSPAASKFEELIDQEVVSINGQQVATIYDVLNLMEEINPNEMFSVGLGNKKEIILVPENLNEQNLIKIANHTFDQYCADRISYQEEVDQIVVTIEAKKYTIKTAGISGNKVFCLNKLAQLGIIIRKYSLQGHIELGKDDSHIYIEEIKFSENMKKRILYY